MTFSLYCTLFTVLSVPHSSIQMPIPWTWWMMIGDRSSSSIFANNNQINEFEFWLQFYTFCQEARAGSSYKFQSGITPHSPKSREIKYRQTHKKVTFDRNCTFYVQMNGVCVSHFTHHINSHPQSPAKYSWSWKVEMCWMEGIEMNEWTKRRRRKRTKQLSAYW